MAIHVTKYNIQCQLDIKPKMNQTIYQTIVSINPHICNSKKPKHTTFLKTSSIKLWSVFLNSNLISVIHLKWLNNLPNITLNVK